MKHAASVLLLAGMIALVYSAAVEAPFVQDDLDHLRRPESSWRDIARMIDPFQRPLSALLWKAGDRLTPGKPLGHHLIGMTLHAIAAGVVYGILITIGVSSLIAFGAAAVFALHPLLSQAVIYSSGNASILCAVFYFIGVWATVRLARESPRRTVLLVVYVLAYISALYTKPDALTLALLSAVVYSLVGPRKIVGAVLVFLSLLGGMATASRALTFDTPYRNFDRRHPAIPEALAQNASVTPFYFLPRVVLPFGLSIDPDVPRASLRSGRFGVAVVVWGLLLGLPWMPGLPLLVRLGVACLAYSPWLARILVISETGWIEEHHAYIPMLGVAFLAAWALSLVREDQVLVWGMAVSVLLGGMTMARAETWRGSLELWRDAAGKAQINARPHAQVGIECAQVRDDACAIAQSGVALHLDPDLYLAENTIAWVELEEGRLAEAEFELRDLVGRAPNFADGWTNVGVLRMRQGRYGEALQAFDRSGTDMAQLNKALLLEGSGHREEGERLYQDVVRRRPDLIPH